ncbi:MAG: glutamate racemase [Myxococcaceae bacterium]|nr:glutamate racemase [Myxococcaceae bacterium]
MLPDDRRPIGVFDSGVGGLTVLRALMERLPHEATVYLGDTARVPYGTKSAEVVTRYSLANARFLLARDVKLLVIACNTASAVGLEALAQQLPIPVLGVIEPGAKVAAARTRTGRVGVIGTPGTVRSGAYARALKRARADLVVTSRACPLFVPLAEEGWTTGEVPRLVARQYLSELATTGVDTLVLGCTHYPLLQGVIAEVMGDGVTLVDSAAAVAEAAEAVLQERGLLAAKAATPPAHAYFVTDTPDRFLEVAGRFLGRPVEQAEQVDIRPV